MTPHPVPCLVEDSVLGRGQASCSESVPRYDFDLSTVSDGSNVRQDFTLEELLQSVCLGDLLNGGNHRGHNGIDGGWRDPLWTVVVQKYYCTRVKHCYLQSGVGGVQVASLLGFWRV